MDGRQLARTSLLLSLVAIAFLVWGCSDDEESPIAPVTTSVEVQITSDPTVTFNPDTGKTTAIVQFIARDKAGYPLDDLDIQVELLLDNEAVDNESLLQEDSAELDASIHLGLVLDASYSMALHSPPAFAPMRTAAREVIAEGLALYEERPGSFTWNVSWFAETISQPASEGRTWTPDDLLTIPEPGPGTATKLFAAVEHQAGRMLEDHADLANGPHDHHVMIVLSDGADNYSWFDNAAFSNQAVTSSGAPYEIGGWNFSDIDSASVAIGRHPNLTVHVLGLGSSVRDSQLETLANAGGGRYIKNPSSSEVGTLFDSVTREFATIQNQGATIPLPPGDYRFTLRVRTADGQAHDDYSFDFHAGDGSAGLLP
jgi:hypothetical protein